MPKFQLYFRNDDDNFLSKQKLQVSWKMHLTLIDTYKQISWRRGKIAFEVTYFLLKIYFIFSGTQTSQQTTATTTNTNVNDRNNNQEVTTPLTWQEFTVPPIWKRLVAEIIDFFFLFLLKLLVTFAAVDMLSIIDLERYDDDFMNFDLFSVKSPFVLFQIRLVIFCRCGNRRHWCFRPSNSIGIYEWFRIFRNDS